MTMYYNQKQRRVIYQASTLGYTGKTNSKDIQQ